MLSNHEESLLRHLSPFLLPPGVLLVVQLLPRAPIGWWQNKARWRLVPYEFWMETFQLVWCKITQLTCSSHRHTNMQITHLYTRCFWLGFSGSLCIYFWKILSFYHIIINFNTDMRLWLDVPLLCLCCTSWTFWILCFLTASPSSGTSRQHPLPRDASIQAGHGDHLEHRDLEQVHAGWRRQSAGRLAPPRQDGREPAEVRPADSRPAPNRWVDTHWGLLIIDWLI